MINSTNGGLTESTRRIYVQTYSELMTQTHETRQVLRLSVSWFFMTEQKEIETLMLEILRYLHALHILAMMFLWQPGMSLQI
jgi:hypothetical protein